MAKIIPITEHYQHFWSQVAHSSLVLAWVGQFYSWTESWYRSSCFRVVYFNAISTRPRLTKTQVPPLHRSSLPD